MNSLLARGLEGIWMQRDHLKICMISTEYALHPPFGGIATYTREAATWLAARGHEVHVVLVSRDGSYGAEEDAGVLVHTVPTQRIRPRRILAYAARIPGLTMLSEAYAGWNLLEDSLGAWRAVRRLSSLRQFDVVEVPDWKALGFWGTTNRFRRVPILIRSHSLVNRALPGWDWAGIRFQSALEEFAVQRADFVLTVSRERAEYYRSALGLGAERIAALHSGINTSRFHTAPMRPASLSSDDVSILYLGRVERSKGCDVLFDALRIVHRTAPAVRVVFVGPVNADIKESFDAFLHETASWATYVGAIPQDEVLTYLTQSDLIVLPSRFETLPRVLIEALAAGVPQVASLANGIPEIVEHGVTGLLVDPITPDAFAEAIIQLVSSAELRASMSQRSRERALAKFELDAVMEKQLGVYRALAAGTSPQSTIEA